MKHNQQPELSRLKTAVFLGSAFAAIGFVAIAIGYAIHVFDLYEGGYRIKLYAVDSIEDAVMTEIPFLVIGCIIGLLAYFTYPAHQKKRASKRK